MTQANEALVRHILGELIDTHTGAPLAAAVRAVGVDGGKVSVDIQLGYPAAGAIASLTGRVQQALEATRRSNRLLSRSPAASTYTRCKARWHRCRT